MKVQEIILHCTATKEGVEVFAKDVDKWHKNKGWQMIGYHYLVDLDGKVEKGRPDNMNGAHTVNHNSKALGVCYVGGLDKNSKSKDTRTPEQRFALFKLVMELLEKYNLKIEDVHGHYEFANKACPCFDIPTFRKELSQFIDNSKSN